MGNINQSLTYFATFLFCIQLEFSHISITSVILNKNNHLVTSTESRFIMSFTLVKWQRFTMCIDNILISKW